jgi:hypothetical protein
MFVDQIFEECAEILGTTDEKRVYRKITQAVQTLMESGHWMQSTADVDVCTGWDGCTIALPRGIDVPLAVNVDGSPVYFRNRLFQYHVNKGGKFNTVEWAWDDRGYVATLMQIIQPSQLVAIAESENDVGKIIRVTGTDSNNRDLRSQLKDGTGVDGLLIPIHSQSDFAYGTIAPDDATIRTREVAITPISKFASATPHTLDSGQGMEVTAISGTIPVPLSNGQTYYIGVLDALTIQIYNDSLNAQAGNYPLSLQSIVGAGPLKFLDSRTSFVTTALQFASAPTIEITTANPLTFPSGQTLPIGIRSGVTYFGNLLDATHLQIFGSISDAQANVNEVHTTGSTNPINVDIRKEIVPETKLTFSVDHLLTQGDQVQVFTSGGTLPQPLLANQNYFVNIVDTKAVSIHTTQADALASSPTNFVNPIKITSAGVGTISLIKLIPASAVAGEASQITAPGLSIALPSGAGANFTPIVVGSVTSVNLSDQGSSYTADPTVLFSAPPAPPSGSTISVRTATGYAIRNSITYQLSSIVIEDPGFGYTTAPSVTITPPPDYVPIEVTKMVTNGITVTATTISNHGFRTGDSVTISGATPVGYTGDFVVTVLSSTSFTFELVTEIGQTVSVTALTRLSTTATGTTSAPHGFAPAQVIAISGATPDGYNGNKTLLTASGSTFTYTVSSSLTTPATGTIEAFSSPATESSPPTPIKVRLKAGTLATANATIQTSFVVGFTQISGGSGYVNAPQVEITGGGGSGATATANINTTNLSINSISKSTPTSTIANATTSSPHGFRSGQSVKISGAFESDYNGDKIIQVPKITTNVTSITKASPTATIAVILTSSSHNYITGDRVTLSGCTGTSAVYNNTWSVSVTGSNTFEITVPATAPTPALPPSGILSLIDDKTATTFTFSVLSTTPTPATGAISVFSGEVTSLSVVTSGSGYTSIPNVIITPSTGVFVQFSSTGTLPSPLLSGTSYRAEAPLTASTGTFTVKNADFSKINITSSPTGTFYVVLSRVFGVSFTNKWLGDFTNLTTPSTIYWGTDYLLPTTSPAIDNGSTPAYLNVLSTSLATAYTSDTSATGGLTSNTITLSSLSSGGTTTATANTLTPHYLQVGQKVTILGASIGGFNGTFTVLTSSTNSFTYTVLAGLGTPSGTITATTGLISVVSFGTGQSYYAKRFSVSPLPYNNLIQPSSVQFLQENETVKFSTSGVLPSPLVSGTDYQVRVIGDSVNVYSGGVLVPITTPGTGQLSLDIQRTFTAAPSTSIVADASLYTTGQSVTVRANSGDVLPNGLVSGTTYFIRRIDNDEFELYATKAQSQNLVSTTGRISFLTSGLSTDSRFFVDAIEDAILVKSVANIQKPLTDGFVSLYAMDYGRSNDLTLIGQYHPTEVNPQYRRIRIGKPCAWVRIAYRLKPPVITSKYDFIPIEHTRAIICGVHACDLEDKDFAEQSLRYWGFALAYLKNQQEHQDGHAFVPPQVNSETYGDTSDPVMF